MVSAAAVRRLGARLLQSLIVLFVVAVLVFLVVRLIPGDPARQVLGTRGTPEAVEALRHQLGLDVPLPVQFGQYFAGLLHGSLGDSLVRQGVSVQSIVLSGLGITATIVLTCALMSLVVGIPLGMWSARTRSRVVDAATRGAAVLLLAAPPFFLGLVLILVLSLELRLLPAGGWGTGVGGVAAHVVLPAAALSGYLMPLVMRTVRQAAIDAAGQPYVEAALARGLSPRLVTYRHILPNSLLPLVTLIGLNVGTLLSGAVVVEALFAVPGLGTQLANAVQTLDYPVIQGVALIAALGVIISNFAADSLYTFVDPRMRSHG